MKSRIVLAAASECDRKRKACSRAFGAFVLTATGTHRNGEYFCHAPCISYVSRFFCMVAANASTGFEADQLASGVGSADAVGGVNRAKCIWEW